MKLATAFVELRADANKFHSDMNEVQKKSKETADKMAKMFEAAVFGIGLKKSIDAAMELEEAVKRAGTVFGTATEEQEKLATSAAKTMGLSKRAYLDAATGVKNIFNNLGVANDKGNELSGTVVKLGSDLGLWKGVGADVAVGAISKAMLGATRGLRQFGIALTPAMIQQKALALGLWDGVSALSQSARAQATLALIQDKTTAAAGYFAKNQGDAAAATKIAHAEMENAAASLGTSFLPIYTRVVEVVGWLADKFGALPKPLQLALVGIVALVAMVGPIKSMAGAFKALQGAIEGMAIGGAEALIALAAVAAIAATVYFALNGDAAAKRALKKDTEDLTAALKDEALGHKEAALAALAQKLADSGILDTAKKLGLTTKDLADAIMGKSVPALKEMGANFQKLSDFYKGNRNGALELNGVVVTSSKAQNIAVGDLAKSYGLTYDQAAKLLSKTGELTSAYSGAKAKVATMTEVNKDLGLSLDGTTASTDALTGATDASTQATAESAAAKAEDKLAADNLQKSLAPVRDRFDESAAAANALKDALDAVFGGRQTLEQATVTLEAAIDSLTKSFKENGKTVDVHTEKGRTNREAISKQASAIEDLVQAMVKNGASVKDATAYGIAYAQQLENQLIKMGLTRQAAHDYIMELGLTPNNLRTVIELTETETSKNRIDTLLKQLGSIDAAHSAKINALVDQGKYDEAEKVIRQLAADQNVTLTVGVIPPKSVIISLDKDNSPDRLGSAAAPGGGGRTRLIFSAEGNVFDRPTASVFGEDGPEAVLPLSKPSALRRIMGDPRVAAAIANAGSDGASVGSLGGAGSVSIGILNVGSRDDYLDLQRSLARTMFRVTGR